MTAQHPRPTCGDCNAYMERRADILPLYIVAVAKSRGVSAVPLALAYFEGVHRRHLAGLSLDTG